MIVFVIIAGMSLTVLIEVEDLCGELEKLILECLSLKPTYLIVNSLNHEVIDFFLANFGEHHLICYRCQDLNHLLRHVKKTYQTEQYLCLNSLDPILQSKFLQDLIDQFHQSDCLHGQLTNSISRSKLVSKSRLNHPVSTINQMVLYENCLASKKTVCYLETEHTLIYHPIIKLVNRVVMITGALGGIGFETARKYYDEGWRVIALDRLSRKKVPKEQLKIFDRYFQLDLSQVKLDSQIKKILSRLSRLDVLVHVAGYQVCESIRKTQPSSYTWDEVFNVNLRSIYTLTRQCFRLLRNNLGNVVVVSSVHAYVSSEEISMYAISKSALLGLVRNFALEWGKYGIRVNGLAPGAIDTPMLRAGLGRRGDPERVMNNLAERHLMGKIGQPQQIAQSIYFIGDSTQSGFMTGQTVIMDGGASIRLSTEV